MFSNKTETTVEQNRIFVSFAARESSPQDESVRLADFRSYSVKVFAFLFEHKGTKVTKALVFAEQNLGLRSAAVAALARRRLSYLLFRIFA